MSYDLQIWSTLSLDLSLDLAEPGMWCPTGAAWIREGRDWQLVVGPSDRVAPEDIPEEIERLLPGIAFLTQLNLSPITAEDNARRIMVRLARRLSKVAHGVIFDPQQDTITTPRGVTRLAPFGSGETASLIAMSWWFVSGSLIERRIAGLVTLLESILPEALPKRYGFYEPPQCVYADTGRNHFISFFRDSADHGGQLVVWYPHPPVAAVDVSIPPHVGASRQGFRSGQLTIKVDEDALAQPGWATGLMRAWKQISSNVQPFYGDVRTLRGYIRKRGRYWGTAETESHPVPSWWWAGIPAGPVHAAVLGEPYRQLWPSFCDKAEKTGELSFISTGDWLSNADAFSNTGSPPSDIAQLKAEPRPDSDRQYPKSWPFDAPRTER